MSAQVRPSCPDCGRYTRRDGSCRECEQQPFTSPPPPVASTKRLPRMANP